MGNSVIKNRVLVFLIAFAFLLGTFLPGGFSHAENADPNSGDDANPSSVTNSDNGENALPAGGSEDSGGSAPFENASDEGAPIDANADSILSEDGSVLVIKGQGDINAISFTGSTNNTDASDKQGNEADADQSEPDAAADADQSNAERSGSGLDAATAEGIETLVVSSGATSIDEDQILPLLTNLKNIYLPDTFQKIDQNTINSTELKDVYIFSEDAAIEPGTFSTEPTPVTIHGYEGSTAEEFAASSANGSTTFEELDDDLPVTRINAKAATCTKNGYTGDLVYIFTAAASGDGSGDDNGGTTEDVIIDEGDNICPEGHKWVSKLTKATFSNSGKQWQECSVCGKKDNEKTIPKAVVKLNRLSKVYNGKAWKPSVTVKTTAGKKIASSKYTVKYATPKSKALGKYYITVTINDALYTGKTKVEYQIRPNYVFITGTSSTKTTITVKWKKRKNMSLISGYQLMYSTKSDFSKAKTIKIKDKKTTSKKISKLSKGKRYYVKVRVYYKKKGKTYHSIWSKAKSVTTKGKYTSSSKKKEDKGKYTVIFYSNDGTNRTLKQVIKRGTNTVLKLNTFERSGYICSGWATKPGGTVKFHNGEVVCNIAKADKTVKLYAKWQGTTVKKQVKTMLEWCKEICSDTYKYNNNNCSKKGGYCRFCQAGRKKAYFCNSFVIAACVHGMGYNYAPFLSDCKLWKGHGCGGQVRRDFYPAVDNHKGWVRVDIGAGNLNADTASARKTCLSYLEPGDVLMIGTKSSPIRAKTQHYKHTAIYYGGGKITESAGGKGCVIRDIKYVKRGSQNRKIIEVFRYLGEMQKSSFTSVSSGDNKLTLKWKDVSNESGYEIRYSTSSAFGSSVTKTVRYDKSTHSATISGLSDDEKYYVQIRPYQKSNGVRYYQKWSSLTSMRTK